jgi:hypothetical protein
MKRKNTMSRNWTLKYGLAAVLVSIVIIAAVLFANPAFLTPNQSSVAASFVVMLTDPPIVPAGTRVLNLTYSNVSLQVVYTNGTSDWLPVNASGTVNLFSLVNYTQTIASTTIPLNTTVTKIQFTIVSVDAEVNGTIYPVTALSNTIVMSIANSQINQTLSGVLVDFNPTLVQIQATDANGTIVYYYVLVPSATAIVVTDLSREQIKVGTIVELGQNNKVKLVRVVEKFSNNITIVSASLSVNGNVTSLNVTMMNQGNVAFRVFGLTVHGEFNATRTWNMDKKHEYEFIEKIHPDTIPFKANGTSLIPLFGTDHDEYEDMKLSSLILQPGENATLSFSGVIALQPEKEMMDHPAIIVTPIVGGNYTVRLMGEGFETFNVTATAP